MKWWLLAVCLIVCALPATAQFFNLSRVSRPSETTFANNNQPWPFGSLVNAINYDVGGQGTGYNVPSPSGSCLQSSSYRADTVNFNNTPAGGVPYQLGCSSPGISYNYEVNASSIGPFTITANLADTSAGGSWGVYLDNISIGTIATPNTGSFTTFQSALLSAPFNTTPGNHILQFRALGGDAAFNGSGDFLSFVVAPPSTAGIACDIGPNYTGTIPAGAQAAGFTHCRANFDWSSAQFSNPATWLNCTNGATNLIFFFNNQNGSAPCSSVSIVTDGGGRVMDFHWDPSWQPFGEIDPSQLFQEGVYMDWNMRYSSNFTTANATESLIGTIYSESTNCCTVVAFEWDLDEQAIKPGFPFGYNATHSVSWPIGGSPLGSGLQVPTSYNNISGFNPTNYNEYGIRITTDGNTKWAMCNYLNGTFVSCGTTTAGATIAAADQANRWKITVGPLSSTLNTGNAYDAYWQRWTIFTCPGNNNSSPNAQCNNNPPLGTAP